jgi:EAL domain-containing protein (putative c-di-GMP-specific phosphodiesterase class I)
MQTILMPDRAVGLAWLEHFSPDGGMPERTVLDRFPFVIGRNASAELHVNSDRVSREHAVVVQSGGEYRIRDLDSTNGTFVNGRRIKETVLHAGDMLVIANVEYSFGCNEVDLSQRAVTQVMNFEEENEPVQDNGDLILDVRRLHEVLVRGSVSSSYDPIVSLGDERTVAFEALDPEDASAASADGGHLAQSATWPVAARIRHLRRLLAVEEAASLFNNFPLFLPVDACDLGMPGVVEALLGVCNQFAAGRRLVAALPLRSLQDGDPTADVPVRLREGGMGVALDIPTVDRLDVKVPKAFPGDYLRMAPGLMRGIEQRPDRQRFIQSMVRGSRDGEYEVIARGISNKQQRNICEGLGCVLGQGPLFAPSRPIAAGLQRESLSQ